MSDQLPPVLPGFIAPPFNGVTRDKGDRFVWWSWNPTYPYWSKSCHQGTTIDEAIAAAKTPNAIKLRHYHNKLIEERNGKMVEVLDVPHGTPLESIARANGIADPSPTPKWNWMADWCKKKGISPFDSKNWDMAESEWQKANRIGPLQLKEGAFYENGKGEVMGPMRNRSGSELFQDQVGDFYESDGKFCPGGEVENLVKEVEPLPAAPVGEENREQAAFEDWLERVCPSGDHDSVRRQWLASSDYADLHEPEQAAKPAEGVESHLLATRSAEPQKSPNVSDKPTPPKPEGETPIVDKARFTINWRDAAYFVSIPNYQGGDVVPYKTAMTLEVRLGTALSDLAAARENLKLTAEDLKESQDHFHEFKMDAEMTIQRLRASLEAIASGVVQKTGAGGAVSGPDATRESMMRLAEAALAPASQQGGGWSIGKWHSLMEDETDIPKFTGKYLVITGDGPRVVRVEETFMEFDDGSPTDPSEWESWASILAPASSGKGEGELHSEAESYRQAAKEVNRRAKACYINGVADGIDYALGLIPSPLNGKGDA